LSKLLVRPTAGDGLLARVTPQSAGWRHVGFELHRIPAGEHIAATTGDRETCLVLVSGKAEVSADGEDFGLIGERMSPFEGKPWSVYVPQSSRWSLAAETEVVLAVCTAPGLGGGLPARVIGPDDVKQEVRGKGSNVRHVTNILPETEPADSLLVVEVVTPAGHSSSYPPHKHDRDALPDESQLEETYYHRLNPPQGFAFQRVYTDAGPDGTRDLDEAIAVEDGDIVLVPRGYHPCTACHGYDLWYLNVMAGPKRIWRFHNAPEHEWLLKG
jgi:5-deoxy-glucuronate isomerase